MATSRERFSAVFNRMVRHHRLRRRLSQEALSELADVDRTYVGLLERGKRSPGLDVAQKLAAALDVPLADLISEAEREWKKGQAPPQKRTSRGTRGRAR